MDEKYKMHADSVMNVFGENKEKLDALNQQYGYSMKMTDYLKKEATYEGGAEQWLKDRKAAEEAGIVNVLYLCKSNQC